MYPGSIDIYKAAKNAHEVGINRLVDLRKTLRQESGMVEMTDLAFAMREASAMLDDLRKQCNEVRELAEKVACALFVRDFVNQPEVINIKTDYTTATPKPEIVPSLPTRKNDPDGYNKLMTFLGIPAEYAQAGESEYKAPVQLYWPGIVELLTKLHCEGKAMPPGIDVTKCYPSFKLVMRKRKEPDADIAAESLAEATPTTGSGIPF